MKPAVSLDGTPLATPEQLIEQLRAMRQHIPEFEPLPVGSAKARSRAGHVGDTFLQVGISAIGASPLVASAIGKDAETALQERDEAARWSAFETELRTLLEGVAGANRTRSQRLGILALQAYTIAKGLVRQQEHAALVPLVEAMRGMNKFARKAKHPRPEPRVEVAPAKE
ncbi:MAG TPA: hypothetical protein VF618_05445 [Thermoanaerobaculia bacterium]